MTHALVTPSRTTPGKSYVITFHDDRPATCTCVGFAYRDTCRHVRENVYDPFIVYCGACMTDVLTGVTREAAKAYARSTRCCSTDLLYPTKDLDAASRQAVSA